MSAAGPSTPGPRLGIGLLVDEDFDNDILRGVLRKWPGVDVVRVQDVGLTGAADPDVLEWAAQHGRVLLTHDVSTMKTRPYDRVAQSKPMPGVFALGQDVPIAVGSTRSSCWANAASRASGRARCGISHCDAAAGRGCIAPRTAGESGTRRAAGGG